MLQDLKASESGPCEIDLISPDESSQALIQSYSPDLHLLSQPPSLAPLFPCEQQAAKLCNNLVLGITMAGVCEGHALAERLGLDQKKLAEILNTSSGRRSPLRSALRCSAQQWRSADRCLLCLAIWRVDRVPSVFRGWGGPSSG